MKSCVQVNSEICEQTFSWMSRYAKMTRHTNRERFFVFYCMNSITDTNNTHTNLRCIYMKTFFCIPFNYTHKNTWKCFNPNAGLRLRSTWSGNVWTVHVLPELLWNTRILWQGGVLLTKHGTTGHSSINKDTSVLTGLGYPGMSQALPASPTYTGCVYYNLRSLNGT